MDISQLRMEHPELVAQIEAEARAGMIAQADAASAQAAAVTAEQTRMVGLVAATMGEAVGAKLGAIAAKGLSAEDVTTLGITLSAESAGSTFDEESRAAILAGLQAAAPTGVKAAKLETGAAAERASVVSAIAAGGSRK